MQLLGKSSGQVFHYNLMHIHAGPLLCVIIIINIPIFRKFSRQQYFDSSGLFISIVFAGPIVSNCLLIVVSILDDRLPYIGYEVVKY